MKLKTALMLVEHELERAKIAHTPFQSPHEGYAIILEEVDELWQAIRNIKHRNERSKDMRTEAIQVCAMALRFLTDLIEE